MDNLTNPFSGVKYYIIKCNNQNAISLLKSVDASANPFLSESLKFAISDEEDNLENGEAEDIYAVPVVTSKWVTDSFSISKLLPTQFYHPSYKPLFKDLTFVFSELSLNDRVSLSGIVKVLGAIVEKDLTQNCTHLVIGLPRGLMYDYLKDNNLLDSKIIITPDWIYDCIEKKSLVPHDDFNPSLLKLPKPKPLKIPEPHPPPPTEPELVLENLKEERTHENAIIENTSSPTQPSNNQISQEKIRPSNNPVKPNFNMTMGTNLAAAASTSVQQILSQGNQLMNQPLTNLNAAQMGSKLSFNSPKKSNLSCDQITNHTSSSRTNKSSKSKMSRNTQEQNMNEEEKDAIVMRNVMNILSQQHNWKKDSESGSRGGNSSDSFSSQNGTNNSNVQSLSGTNCNTGKQKSKSNINAKSTARSSSGQSSSNTTPQKSPKNRAQPQNYQPTTYSSPQQPQKTMFRPGMKGPVGNYPQNSVMVPQQSSNQMQQSQPNLQNIPRQPSFVNVPNQMGNIDQNHTNTFVTPNQVPCRSPQLQVPHQIQQQQRFLNNQQLQQQPVLSGQINAPGNMTKIYNAAPCDVKNSNQPIVMKQHSSQQSINPHNQGQFLSADQMRPNTSEPQQHQNVEFPQSLDIINQNTATPNKKTNPSGNMSSPMAKSPHPSHVSPGRSGSYCGHPLANTTTSPSPQKMISQKQSPICHQVQQVQNHQPGPYPSGAYPSVGGPSSTAPQMQTSSRYDDQLVLPQHQQQQQQQINPANMHLSQQQNFQMKYPQQQQMTNIMRPPNMQGTSSFMTTPGRPMSQHIAYPNHPMLPGQNQQNQYFQSQKIQMARYQRPNQMQMPPQNHQIPQHPQQQQSQPQQNFVKQIPTQQQHQQMLVQQQQQQQHQIQQRTTPSPHSQMRLPMGAGPGSGGGMPVNQQQQAIRFPGNLHHPQQQQQQVNNEPITQMNQIHQEYPKPPIMNMNPQLQNLLMNKQPQSLPQQQQQQQQQHNSNLQHAQQHPGHYVQGHHHPGQMHQNHQQLQQQQQQQQQKIQQKFIQNSPNQQSLYQSPSSLKDPNIVVSMDVTNQKIHPNPQTSFHMNQNPQHNYRPVVPQQSTPNLNPQQQQQQQQGSAPNQPHNNPSSSNTITIPQYHTVSGSPTLEKEDECLFGCVILLAGYDEVDPTVKAKWRKVMRSKGADVIPYYDPSKVTHLVIDWQLYDPDLFKQALKDQKRIVTIHWINHVISIKKQVVPDEILHLPSPFSQSCTFSFIRSQIITSTGFQGKEKVKVEHIIKSIGAKYTDYMDESNTILICKQPIGPKYEAAQTWGIPCVNVRWLQDLYLGDVSALSIEISRHYLSFEASDVNLSLYVKTTRVLDLLVGWRSPITMTEELYKHHCELRNNNEKTSDEEEKKENLASESNQPSCLDCLSKDEVNMSASCRLRSERLEKDKEEQRQFYMKKELECCTNRPTPTPTSETPVIPVNTENNNSVPTSSTPTVVEESSTPMEEDPPVVKQPKPEPMDEDTKKEDLQSTDQDDSPVDKTNRKRGLVEPSPDEPTNKMPTEETATDHNPVVNSPLSETTLAKAPSLKMSISSDVDESIKIAMTGLSIRQRKELIKIIDTMPNHAEVVEDMKIATHLVAGELVRVPKVYIAIAQGKFICSYKWILASKLRDKWLDENDWLLNDTKGEAKMNFNLKESLYKSRRRLIECEPLLFKGIEFWVSKAIRNRDICLDLIKLSGGIIRDKKPMKKMVLTSPPKQLFICHEDEYASAVHLLKTKAGCRGVHHEEFILGNVLRQTLDFDSYQIRHVASIQTELQALLDSAITMATANNSHLMMINHSNSNPNTTKLLQQQPNQFKNAQLLQAPSNNNSSTGQMTLQQPPQQQQILIHSSPNIPTAHQQPTTPAMLQVKQNNNATANLQPNSQHFQYNPQQTHQPPQQPPNVQSGQYQKQLLFHHQQQQQQQIKYNRLPGPGPQQQHLGSQTNNNPHLFSHHHHIQPQQQQHQQQMIRPQMAQSSNFNTVQQQHQQQFHSIQPHLDQSQQNFVQNPGNRSFLVFSNSMPLNSSGHRPQLYQAKPGGHENIATMINGQTITTTNSNATYPSNPQQQQLQISNPQQFFGHSQSIQQQVPTHPVQQQQQSNSNQGQINIMPRNQLICNSPANQQKNNPNLQPLPNQQQSQLNMQNQNLSMMPSGGVAISNSHLGQTMTSSHSYALINNHPQNFRLVNPGKSTSPSQHQKPPTSIGNPNASQVVPQMFPITLAPQTQVQTSITQMMNQKESLPISNSPAAQASQGHSQSSSNATTPLQEPRKPEQEIDLPQMKGTEISASYSSPQIQDNLLKKPEENLKISSGGDNVSLESVEKKEPEISPKTVIEEKQDDVSGYQETEVARLLSKNEQEDTQSTVACNQTIDDSIGPPESLPTELMENNTFVTNISNISNIEKKSDQEKIE